MFALYVCPEAEISKMISLVVSVSKMTASDCRYQVLAWSYRYQTCIDMD